MKTYHHLAGRCSSAFATGAFLVACGPIGSSPSALPSSGADATAGSSGDGGAETKPPSPITIDPTMTFQTMDGFGGADTYAPGGPITTAEGNLFFGMDGGIGLSLLRVGIDVNGAPMGGDAVYSDIKMAGSYGAKVWGAPWSPPGAYKDNGSEFNGGHLCAADGGGVADGGDGGDSCTGDDYQAWATQLAGFAATVYAQTQVQLYAISAQNEPDFPASYASCLYTAPEMVAFLDVLGPTLGALQPPVKLIAPEPEGWSDLWTGTAFGSAILADPTASGLVDIFATHDYGYKPIAPPSGVSQHIWETEVAGLMGKDPVISGPNVTIDNGLVVATWIANAITLGGASAWHHWWLVSQNSDDNEGLLFQPGTGPDGGAGAVDNPPKRLYTLGNFSRFVRPGYVRIGTSGSAPLDVSLVAFNNPADGTLVLVAINQSLNDAGLALTVGSGTMPSQFTPWVTSATENLAMQPAVTATAGTFTVTVPAQSVATFVSSP
jgi:glucuronoarabinoxylan endo-1,4-beta-xylanase